MQVNQEALQLANFTFRNATGIEFTTEEARNAVILGIRMFRQPLLDKGYDVPEGDQELHDFFLEMAKTDPEFKNILQQAILNFEL